MCPRPDHIHFIIEADSQAQISAFVDVYSTLFAREFNASLERSCHVFRTPYGMANKLKEKVQRSAVIYVLNNPVEKKLTRKMEQWRWNFFEYGESRHPFSQPLSLSAASRKLRRAIAMVRSAHSSGRHLSPAMLDNLFKDLSVTEMDQLVDFIIVTYNCLDYQRLETLFDSLSNLRFAAGTTTGSEHDLHEEMTSTSDTAYSSITSLVLKRIPLRNVRDVIKLPVEKKVCLMNELFARGIATRLQLSKYFQLEPVAAK